MLYFAYGSNLDYTRMLNRCESADVIGQATLEGYRLVFMENNSKRFVANVVKNKKFTTYGVLYEVNEKDMKNLDKYEGHPFVYKRTKISVCVKGEYKEAITYIMPKRCQVYSSVLLRQYGVPKKDYMQYILNGYAMYNLPQEELRQSYVYSKNKEKERKQKNMSKMITVFVYGTLKRGYRNNIFMERAEYIGEGKINNFDIYKVGQYGAYPAIIKGTGEVYGEVYKVTPEELVNIDRLEGYHGENCTNNLYDKELIEVEIDGEIINAYAYVWCKYRKLPMGSKKLKDSF